MNAGQEMVSSTANFINSPNSSSPNSPFRRLCHKLLSPKQSPERNKSNSGFHCEDSYSAMNAGQELIVSSTGNSTSSPNSSSPSSPFRRLCHKLLSPKQSPGRNKSNSGFHREDSDEIVIQRVFNYFDENGDGKISAPELQSRVRTVSGEILSKEEAEMAVQSTDSDEDGLLDLEDFSKLITSGSGGGSEEEEELREAFGMYAAEGTGCITPKSLKRMLSRLGQSTSVSNCEVMIRKFDLNGDGVLNFVEFRAMMTVH